MTEERRMYEAGVDAPLKERLRDYMSHNDHVSFAELGNRFGSAFQGGDRALELAENLLIWANVTDEGAAAVLELLEEKVIVLQPSSEMVYLCDGRVLPLPIAKRRQVYRTPHWCPVTLRPVSRVKERRPPSRRKPPSVHA